MSCCIAEPECWLVTCFPLLHTGLSLLNLSLDTLRPERFEQMTRRRGHDRVLETLDLALTLGFDPVKVRLWRLVSEHGIYAPPCRLHQFVIYTSSLHLLPFYCQKNG